MVKRRVSLSLSRMLYDCMRPPLITAAAISHIIGGGGLFLRMGLATTVVLLTTIEPTAARDATSAMRRITRIPPQELRSALATLAKERRVQLIYRSALVGDRRTPGASGTLTLQEALAELLRGSGLTYRFLNDHTVTIVAIVHHDRRAYVPPKPPRSIHTRWSLLGYALAALTASGPGFAQSAPAATAGPSMADSNSPLQLQEIVVTATKRAESIQKVPISVTAFTRSSMDMQEIRSFNDIAQISPSVTITPQPIGNTSGSTVSIRGIGSDTGQGTVGIYIDDAPVAIRQGSLSAVNPYPMVFDLKRVEILRGPQGTLFGAGSEGGTIRFITPQPGLHHYSSYIRTDLSSTEGGDPSYELGVAGGGPIVKDRLGFRLSAWYRRNGGYVDRVSWVNGDVIQKNANWNDASVLRGALRLAPTDNLDITASVFYQHQRVNDSSSYWEEFSNPAQGVFHNGNPLAAPTDDRFTLPALHIVWSFAGMQLINNTSYLDRHDNNVFDDSTLSLADFANYAPHYLPQQFQQYNTPGYLVDTQNSLTEELRLQSNEPASRLTWVVGAYFQHAHQDGENNIQNPYLNPTLTALYGVPVNFQFYQNIWFLYSTQSTIDEEKALFGQLDYRILPKLTLTAGVRVSHHTYKNTGFADGPVVGGVANISSASQSDTPVTPKYVVSYQVNKNNMVYVSEAKGYRQGAALPAQPSNCAADLAALGLGTGPSVIKPDDVWSTEVGAKDSMLDGRLVLDSSVYRIAWNNIQTQLILPSCGVPFTTNLGNAISKGVDAQADYLVTRRLSLMLALSYSDAKYTTTTTGAAGKIIRSAGQPLPIAPWKVSASAQYDFRAFGHRSYFRVDDQFQSHDSTPLDYASYLTDPTIPRPPGYNLLSMRLGFRVGYWDLSIYGTNIGNVHPEISRYRDNMTTFLYRGLTITPRTIGVTGIFRY